MTGNVLGIRGGGTLGLGWKEMCRHRKSLCETGDCLRSLDSSSDCAPLPSDFHPSSGVSPNLSSLLNRLWRYPEIHTHVHVCVGV